MGTLYEYKIWYHGDFVGFATAMTKGEAVTQFHNRYPNMPESSLMATVNTRVFN